MSASQALDLAIIRIDGGTQPRAVISEATVRDYAESMTGGVPLPPIDVFFDSATYWLADGFHRYFAALGLKYPAITATVHLGTKRDAVLFSVGANHGHGLQRTNADKQKAVMTLLGDSEWGQWSNKEIARRCGVDASTVDKWRARSLPDSGSDASATQSTTCNPASAGRYTTKHGTEATMKTGKIGRRPVTLDKSRAGVVARRDRMQQMATEGYSAHQIAAALHVGVLGLRVRLKKYGIDVPADRAIGKVQRHNANRIVEHMVSDAENLTADVGLIEFGQLDPTKLRSWVASLIVAKGALDVFIRRLMKEQKKYEAA